MRRILGTGLAAFVTCGLAWGLAAPARAEDRAGWQDPAASKAAVASKNASKECAACDAWTKRDAYGVTWYATLDAAKAAAVPEKGEAKPIVWFRVLGDLDGLT